MERQHRGSWWQSMNESGSGSKCMTRAVEAICQQWHERLRWWLPLRESTALIGHRGGGGDSEVVTFDLRSLGPCNVPWTPLPHLKDACTVFRDHQRHFFLQQSAQKTGISLGLKPKPHLSPSSSSVFSIFSILSLSPRSSLSPIYTFSIYTFFNLHLHILASV